MVTVKLKLQDRKKLAMLRAGERALQVEGTANAKVCRWKTVLARSGARKRPTRQACMGRGAARMR